MGNCCNYRMITTRKIYKEFNSYFVMVKASTKATIGVAMYAASTVAGFAEDVKKSFEYLGKTYLLSQGATITQDREPEQGGPIHKRYDIITREDDSEMIFRQDDSGDWFCDKNYNNKKDCGERNVSNDFGMRAERAKNLEKLAEFEYQSNRPDENKGKTFEYELWSDGTISQKGKPSVTFSQNWRYDSDAKGIMTWMHDEFNEKANGQIKDAFGSLIDRYNTSQEEIKELKKEKKELIDIVEYHADGKGNVAFDDMKILYDQLNEISYIDRIKTFSLREDRADVILPALRLYMRILTLSECEHIIVPKTGLADGIIRSLFLKDYGLKKLKF